jgi:hypothetical protein
VPKPKSGRAVGGPVAAREQHSRAAGQLRERRLGAATSSAGTTSLTRPPPTARRSRYSAPDSPGSASSLRTRSTSAYDWTHACEDVAQDDPPDFCRAPAYVRASLPVPIFGWGTIPRPIRPPARRRPNMIPGPIADHASLPGEHPVVRRTRPVAVRYRSRREPRPDRSPRSQRSFATSATYGNSASSRARLTARATWL